MPSLIFEFIPLLFSITFNQTFMRVKIKFMNDDIHHEINGLTIIHIGWCSGVISSSILISKSLCCAVCYEHEWDSDLAEYW